jgi:rfaE bifunctional protein kinase chain/domain
MKNILIVGDVMLDHYLVGECTRISPEAPVPVVNIMKEEWRLGGAANVANNVRALGMNCTLIGLCGQDTAAYKLDELLSKDKSVYSKIYKSQKRPTIVKSRVLVGGHQMIRLDKENVSPLNKEEENNLLKTIVSEVDSADLILISDYCKGILSGEILAAIFKTAKILNKPTIVDPKSSDFSIYKGASIIKPNRKEAELATGIKIIDHSSLRLASKKIRDITEANMVITTLSEDGVGLFQNNTLEVIPTQAKKVFDVTGAGDTYLSAFAYQYLLTNNAIIACEFANLAAAVVISKIGSSTASIEEINQLKSEAVAYEY